MAKSADGAKKPIFKRVWFWVVVVLVIAAVGGAGASKPTASSGSDAATSGDTATTEAASTEAATEEQDLSKLAVGDSVNMPSGLVVTVNSYEAGLENYDGSDVTVVNVTYQNNGDEEETFNIYDWKGEDAQGAQRNTTFYSDAEDDLSSGSLAAGGTVTGNIYFDGDLSRVLYYGNVFEKSATAGWTLD